MKPKPYKQGVLKEIYEYFIRPLIHLKPRSIHFQDWLEIIFSSSERSIIRYRSRRRFKMPGKLWLTPHKLSAELGRRLIPRDAQVWIRTDVKDPERNDVEVLMGSGHPKQIFALNQAEYQHILPYLEVWQFRKYKRVKASWEKE